MSAHLMIDRREKKMSMILWEELLHKTYLTVREMVVDLYENKMMTALEIAALLGISEVAVRRKMRELEIQPRVKGHKNRPQEYRKKYYTYFEMHF